MASQPLETIYEEPTPAPTPIHVTADPPKTKPAKDPKRVAIGKKLGRCHRQAWAALKKAEAEEAEAASEASASDTTTTANGSGLSLVAVLGIGGLIVSLLGVYYQREAIMARLKPPPPPPSPLPVKRGIREMK